MEKSVENFYNKENRPDYYLKYEEEHGKRISFIFDRYNFKEIKNKTLGDFGGGYGLLLSKFDDSNRKHVLDGASLQSQYRRAGIEYTKIDLDFEKIQSRDALFDISFALEVLEHLSNPYHVLCQMKQFTVSNGDIYISIPDVRCEHNFLYPGLFVPETNFEEFLGQMALPIVDKVYSNHSFPSWIFKCINKPWGEKTLKFPKREEKFRDVGPLDCTNL